jgi:rabenosyn-5
MAFYEKEISLLSTFKTFIDSNILFELNENDPDVIPSGLTDLEFEQFIQLSSHEKRNDLQNWIKRTGWEKDRVKCYIDGCDKQLGILNGRFHCYKCGHQVCLEHSLFQMKLSVLAKHDPINGIWARVCQGCFQTSRVFQRGVSRCKTSLFLHIRKQKVTVLLMESNKIEKRLQKVIISNQLKDNHHMNINTQVIPWVSDSSYHDCHVCHSNFGLLNRKHHCRLCGQLICQNCSKSIPLTSSNGFRSCTNCAYLLSL